MEGGYHIQLTSLFASNLNMGKVVISDVEFNLSADVISSTSCIPSHGEKWFKGMDLDPEDYKEILKPHAREEPEYLFPFKHLLNKYAPLMMLIMKYFTCEGIFYKFYRYHIRLLMHFTSTKSLDFPHYLYRSLIKMNEKV